MISFRLSPEEYDHLEQIRASRRVPSLSHLARSAMQSLAAGEDGQDVLAYELTSLRRQIQSLSLELERLAAKMNHTATQKTSSGR